MENYITSFTVCSLGTDIITKDSIIFPDSSCNVGKVYESDIIWDCLIYRESASLLIILVKKPSVRTDWQLNVLLMCSTAHVLLMCSTAYVLLTDGLFSHMCSAAPATSIAHVFLMCSTAHVFYSSSGLYCSCVSFCMFLQVLRSVLNHTYSRNCFELSTFYEKSFWTWKTLVKQHVLESPHWMNFITFIWYRVPSGYPKLIMDAPIHLNPLSQNSSLGMHSISQYNMAFNGILITCWYF